MFFDKTVISAIISNITFALFHNEGLFTYNNDNDLEKKLNGIYEMSVFGPF